MGMDEHTVWSIMAGGLLSLALLSAADALVTRRLGAVRNLLLISSIGSVCVLLSGLPEEIFWAAPPRLFLMLKATVAPLAGALGLRFLGIWIGGARQDRLLFGITFWGCYVLFAMALALAVMAALVPVRNFSQVLILSAGASALTVALILLAAVRATLARWLVVAGLLLAVMLAGLYLHALGIELRMRWWLLTASSALLFLLVVIVLMVARGRAHRELERLGQLGMGNDPVTGLPTGARLLTEVEHAFWRTGRLRGQCVVVCVYISNLYEFGDSIGRAVDHQILSTTAARIRRAAGFRCVLGLYQPRCFAIVFSLDRRHIFDAASLNRIRIHVSQLLQVTGSDEKRYRFLPQIGLSSLSVRPDQVQPLDVLDEAERLAMDEVRRTRQGPVSGIDEDQIDTTW